MILCVILEIPAVGACVHADQAQRADCRASGQQEKSIFNCLDYYWLIDQAETVLLFFADVLDFVCPNAKTLMTSLPFGDHDRLPHPTSCRNFFMCLLSGWFRIYLNREFII